MSPARRRGRRDPAGRPGVARSPRAVSPHESPKAIGGRVFTKAVRRLRNGGSLGNSRQGARPIGRRRGLPPRSPGRRGVPRASRPRDRPSPQSETRFSAGTIRPSLAAWRGVGERCSSHRRAGGVEKLNFTGTTGRLRPAIRRGAWWSCSPAWWRSNRAPAQAPARAPRRPTPSPEGFLGCRSEGSQWLTEPEPASMCRTVQKHKIGF